MSTNRSFPKAISVLTISLLGLILYAQTFQSGFHYDDNVFIVTNTNIRDISNIKAIWDSGPSESRFIGLLSFALNFHFHQLDAFGYHVTNLIIHIACSVLVFWFMRMVLPLSMGRFSKGPLPELSQQNTIALLAALIFVAHPLQTQAVTYISQRFESLAAFFYLLSICLYVKARLTQKETMLRLGCFFGSLVAAVLGMFTKEIVMTLPLAVMLVEFSFLRKERKAADSQYWLVRLFWGLFLALLLIVPALFSFNFTGLLLDPRPSLSHPGETITLGPYILTQLRVLATFLRLLFFPFNQNLDYDFILSKGLFDPPSTFFSLIVLAAVFGVGVLMFKRERLVSFGIFWFFLILSANFVPRQHVIFEHKLYLVTLGFCMVVTIAAYRLIRDYKKYLLTLSLIVLALAFLSFERNKTWRDDITLWRDVVAKSPQKAASHHNLAVSYADAMDFDRAIRHFTRAIELDPEFKEAYSFRGNMYAKIGQDDLALEDYARAIGIDPQFSEAYYNIGVLYQKKGQSDLALQQYDKALELNPADVKAYNNRSKIFAERKQYVQAISDMNKAIEISPLTSRLYFSRANIYEEMKRDDLALEDYDMALSVKPIYPPAYMYRAELNRRAEQFELAIEDYEKALIFEPKDLRIYFQLGLTYIMTGDYQQALIEYDRILKIDPEFYMAHYQKANIYLAMNEKGKASEEFEKARKLAPASASQILNSLKQK
ncbi:MAG TPA: tetratricopeptide repeat protein [Candidatus Omnitrophota bacterium]|nr:tetratricopeptide repeat protein [Candidatus Omnitrophota bacterium]